MKLRKIYFATLIGLALWVGAYPLQAQPHGAGTSKSSTAIEVEMVGVGNLTVPKEFQVSLYENLIRKLNTNSGFDLVYRDGNSNARAKRNLVRMRSTVTAFKEGSERDRQVTTVKGATRIKVHCEFIDRDGSVLLQRDVEGKVLLFGNNLKATEDFAKKAATAADQARALYLAKPEHGSGS